MRYMPRVQRRSTLARARSPALHLSLFATLVVGLAACKTHASDTSPAGGNEVWGPPGAAVYAQSCARCHGAYLEGDGTAPPIDSVRVASLGDDPLRMTITYGKGQMPAFGGLTTAQVNDVIAYLRTL